jgi:hypothetical protein
MSRKHLIINVLTVIAVVLNSLILGVLVSQTQQLTSVSSGIPKTLNNASPSPTPSITSAPSPLPYSIDIPNPSHSSSTNKLTVTNVKVNASEENFLVSVLNSGLIDLTITAIYIDDYPSHLEKNITVPANSSINLYLAFEEEITTGKTYQIRFLTSLGSSSDYYIIVA